MADVTHELIEKWRNCDLETAPYIFPRDEKALYGKDFIARFDSFDDFVKSSDFASNSFKLHLDLLPTPYLGNLDTARVFLLMLNPGFTPGDYYAERNCPAFRAALIRSIRQQHVEGEYALHALDPKFSWTMGGAWLQSKLRDVAQKINEYRNRSAEETLQQTLKSLSNDIATVEMYPYHSKGFSPNASQKKLLDGLESRRLMLKYVKEVLVPRAKAEEIVLIVTRKVAEWELGEHVNIVKYDAAHAQGASFSYKSLGGRAIIRKLHPKLLKELDDKEADEAAKRK